jgi:hypothetical protein
MAFIQLRFFIRFPVSCAAAASKKRRLLECGGQAFMRHIVFSFLRVTEIFRRIYPKLIIPSRCAKPAIRHEG